MTAVCFSFWEGKEQEEERGVSGRSESRSRDEEQSTASLVSKRLVSNCFVCSQQAVPLPPPAAQLGCAEPTRLCAVCTQPWRNLLSTLQSLPSEILPAQFRGDRLTKSYDDNASHGFRQCRCSCAEQGWQNCMLRDQDLFIQAAWHPCIHCSCSAAFTGLYCIS